MIGLKLAETGEILEKTALRFMRLLQLIDSLASPCLFIPAVGDEGTRQSNSPERDSTTNPLLLAADSASGDV